MQRQLLDHSQTVRHPMRRMLPPVIAAQPATKRDEDDLKLFALSFTAFFVCIYTLIF